VNEPGLRAAVVVAVPADPQARAEAEPGAVFDAVEEAQQGRPTS
jgi:hypothetical protein